MSIFIKLIREVGWMSQAKDWLDQHLRLKQWLWFIALWFAGLVTVLVLTYPLKLLIRLAS